MSELITKSSAQGNIRWRLLGSVSALVICAAIYTGDAAHAEDVDRPTVWIELGGQLERLQNERDAFAPPFTLKHLDAPYNLVSPLTSQQRSPYAFGGEAKISFEPAGTDWVFGVNVRYGRSGSTKNRHQQTSTQERRHFWPKTSTKYSVFYQSVTRFNDTRVNYRESHAVVDFTAGKDVGLGTLGRTSHAVLSIGVRFAQFHTRSNTTLRSFPDPFYPAQGSAPSAHHHSYYGHSDSARNFFGIGPSISVSGSTPFLGDEHTGEISLDWGGNAAVLFGRQRANVDQKISSAYFYYSAFIPKHAYDHTTPFNRTRSVIVPNVGGFAGLSLHRANAKVSFGYRADFFFGAMDSGMDARHTGNVGFSGPFATISIGLGG